MLAASPTATPASVAALVPTTTVPPTSEAPAQIRAPQPSAAGGTADQPTTTTVCATRLVAHEPPGIGRPDRPLRRALASRRAHPAAPSQPQLRPAPGNHARTARSRNLCAANSNRCCQPSHHTCGRHMAGPSRRAQPPCFVDRIADQRFSDFSQRGKYMLLGPGKRRQLIVHLRMTGKCW
ncbi:MAG: DNA-formamidopyrimidine glycosylase family protein [Caldilineaceae bacterium]